MNSTTPTNPFHIYSPQQLKARTQQLGSGEYLIEDLLLKQGISLVVGKSGEGKSPFLYQAMICVAAGIRLFGRAVKQGTVLFMDCENGLAQVERIIWTISEYLGLSEPPAALRLWNLNDSAEGFGKPGHRLEDFVRAEQPAWVIIDPLKTIFPGIDEKNTAANDCYKQLRKLGGEVGCAFTGVHHPRKPSNKPDERPPKLESMQDSREWFDQSRGSMELINGCDVRIGVEKAETPGAAIVVRGFGRVVGEFPRLLLARDTDPDGNARGYRVLGGQDQLAGDQLLTLKKLPPTFRFSDAVTAYGRTDNPTKKYLDKLAALGLIHHDKANGLYRKVDPSGTAENLPTPKGKLLSFPEADPEIGEMESEAA